MSVLSTELESCFTKIVVDSSLPHNRADGLRNWRKGMTICFVVAVFSRFTDLESEDYDFYKGLEYLLTHHVSELNYEITFCTEVGASRSDLPYLHLTPQLHVPFSLVLDQRVWQERDTRFDREWA